MVVDGDVQLGCEWVATSDPNVSLIAAEIISNSSRLRYLSMPKNKFGMTEIPVTLQNTDFLQFLIYI